MSLPAISITAVTFSRAEETYGMKPPWNVALGRVSRLPSPATAVPHSHQIPAGEEGSPAVEEKLQSGNGTENANLNWNPAVRTDAGKRQLGMTFGRS